jgi:hypothetical protein
MCASAWTHHVRADASARPHGRECFIPGNFKKDAIVRPSHGRPRGHRPTVRPSEIFRVTTLLRSTSCFGFYLVFDGGFCGVLLIVSGNG